MAEQHKRKGWLASILDRGDGDTDRTLDYELVVLEGADADARFPLDRPHMQIGRAIPGSQNPGGIELTDRSVSARHALLAHEDGRLTIEHLPSASNPTLVNGRRLKAKPKRIRDGDRIVLGLVVLELRAIRTAVASPTPEPPPRPAEEDRAAQAVIETDPENAIGEIVVREGPEALIGRHFSLARRHTSIGRDEDCDVMLDVTAVSRSHASLVWEDDQLVLIHESHVNPTHVNGMEIRDRRRVFHGDEIRVAEQVVFEVLLEVPGMASAGPLDSPEVSDAAATRYETPPAAAPVEADSEATRYTTPPASPEPPVPTPEPPVADDEPTRISMVSEPDDDAAATRIDVFPEETGVSEPAPPDDDESEAPTQIFQVPRVPTPSPAPAATPTPAPTPAPPAAAPASPAFSEGDATRIAEPPPAAAASSSDETQADGTAPVIPARELEATRIDEAPQAVVEEPAVDEPEPEKGAYSDGAATRIADVPAQPSYSEGEATRITDAPAPSPYSEGEATRIADVPAASPYSEGEATRIAPAPVIPDSATPDVTRVAGSPEPASSEPAETPESSDEARTMIRRSPYADGDKTRVVDLDAQLPPPAPPPSDDAKTMIRPAPSLPSDGERTVIRPASSADPPARDPDATMIRPVPGGQSNPAPDAPVSETVILDGPDEDADEDGEDKH